MRRRFSYQGTEESGTPGKYPSRKRNAALRPGEERSSVCHLNHDQAWYDSLDWSRFKEGPERTKQQDRAKEKVKVWEAKQTQGKEGGLPEKKQRRKNSQQQPAMGADAQDGMEVEQPELDNGGDFNLPCMRCKSIYSTIKNPIVLCDGCDEGGLHLMCFRPRRKSVPPGDVSFLVYSI